MISLRRFVFLFVLVCLGCSAQSGSSDVSVRIERQVRSYYSIPPDVKITVSPRKASEFPNYDAVTVTFDSGEKKHDYEFLISKDDKTLIRMTKLDLTKDPYAEVMQKIDPRGRPLRGNKDAKVVLVNYDDFECPFCSRMHQTLFPELLKEYGDRVEFIYKDFPLVEIHPWAMHAAVDANCVAAQSPEAYWDFADYLHANQHDVSSAKDHDGQLAVLDRLAMDQAFQAQAWMRKNFNPASKRRMKTRSKPRSKRATRWEWMPPQPSTSTAKRSMARKPIGELRAALNRALQAGGYRRARAFHGNARPRRRAS